MPHWLRFLGAIGLGLFALMETLMCIPVGPRTPCHSVLAILLWLFCAKSIRGLRA